MNVRRFTLTIVSLIALASTAISTASAQQAPTVTPSLPTVEGMVGESYGNRMHPGIFYIGIRPYLAEFPAHFNMEYYDYVAEEFFISGTANGAPYRTRIAVRRPADVENWSGFTLVEVQHTAGAAQTWMSTRIGGMLNGHAYVETVDNTGAVENIQNFNSARYAGISIANNETPTQNDLIAQVAYMLRTAHPSGAEWNASVLAITGTSQTSRAAMDYMETGQPMYRLPDGGPLIDGMFVYSTNGPSAETLAELYQEPIIIMPTNDEFDEFDAEDVAGLAEDTDSYRLYQVPGMPHLEGRHFIATDPANCVLPIDHFMFTAYVFLGVQHLYNWLVNDVEPPHADRVAFESSGTVTRDEYGNPLGGVRSPQLEVPTHTWSVDNEGNASQCDIAGTTIPLANEQLRALYSSPGDYANKLVQTTDELIAEGWFPAEYLFEIVDEIHGFGPQVGFAHTEEVDAGGG